MDNHLKKQLEKTQTWFCKYFPKRIRNVGERKWLTDRWYMTSRTDEALKQWHK